MPREDNLLCVRKRKFVITTDSNHPRKVYPNLARNMILTAADQLWRAPVAAGEGISGAFEPIGFGGNRPRMGYARTGYAPIAPGVLPDVCDIPQKRNGCQGVWLRAAH